MQRRNNEMDKPWVNQDIRKQIWHRIQLANTAKKTKAASDFQALKEQKAKVEAMMSSARVNWLAQNPHLEDEWLKVLADENIGRSCWCDVCEKGFTTPALLQEHESEHATCGIDGCTYTAHQDVLEKHIMHQHLTGLYNKIPQGNSPEEIQKWKEERKKNFPTREKIASKDAEKAEMRARGEVMRLSNKQKERTEKTAQSQDINQPQNQEPEWECNCKARFLVRDGRGRGGHGRGRGSFGRRNFMKNLRHQSHCKELENIRARVKEKRETKANQYLERLKLRQKAENSTTTTATTNGTNNHASNPAQNSDENVNLRIGGVVRREEDAEMSCSDDENEQWNGGMFMFAGTVGWRTHSHHSTTNNTTSPSSDTVKATASDTPTFHISDDEDDEEGNKRSADFHISDDDDYEPRAAVPTEILVAESPLENTDSLKVATLNNNDENDEDDEDGPPVEMKILKNMDEEATDDVKIDQENSNCTLEPPVTETSSDPSQTTALSRKRKRKPATNTSDDLAQSKQPRQTSARDVLSARLRPVTLLERLLLDEIKRERNLILQCIRYVRAHNFLQPVISTENAGGGEKEKNSGCEKT